MSVSFSPEARMIVASNIAVAEAVLALARKGQAGTTFQSDHQMVEMSIAKTLEEFDSKVSKLFPATQQ